MIVINTAQLTSICRVGKTREQVKYVHSIMKYTNGHIQIMQVILAEIKEFSEPPRKPFLRINVFRPKYLN